MCVKSEFYIGPSSYQVIFGEWSMLSCSPDLLWSSTLIMFRWEQSKQYWNNDSAFMLMPCDVNHNCISAYQQWMSPFSASFLDDISANLGYLRLGSSQRYWINVTDRNNASVIIGAGPISARIILWGTDALLLIMRAIIDTNGFSKSFQWFSLWRLGPHISTP